MASRRFEPSRGLRGTITAPPDKSISHRAAILGAMSEGDCRIDRYLDAADTRSTLGAVESLGAGVQVREGEGEGEREGGALSVEISGVGLRGARARGPVAIDVGNAGTLIRLISGWLVGQEGASFTLDGDESIRSRPMDRIVDPLRAAGAVIGTADRGRPPLVIEGTRLKSASHRLEIASAQVKSCLLLAGLLADGPTTVREPEPSRDHTERMLRASGVRLSRRELARVPVVPAAAELIVEPTDRIQLPDLTVPGDLSSAAFHLVAGVLIGGSRVSVTGVGVNPTRTGILGILNRMGAGITVEEAGTRAGEPIATITARPAALRGVRVSGPEVPLAIDELPLVALLGCFARGETTLSGASELRHKETDRIATVCAAIEAIGGEIEVTEDGFVVAGTDGGGIRGGRVEAAGDHRIAMLGAIAGLASEGGVEVAGIEAASISYPGFEADLASLGAPC